NIDGHGLTIASTKESAIVTTSGLKLDLTDGAITSQAEAAISGDGGDLNLVNTKVSGGDAGISMKNGLRLKASKKTRSAATSGNAIQTTSNADVTVNDAAIEGGMKAFKSTLNTKLKLQQGTRLAGRKGGIETDGNLELDATGATVEGGSGPGIQAGGYNAR